MKPTLRLALLAGLLLAALPAATAGGQVRVDGQVYGLVYASERAGTRQWDTYQGLQLRVKPRADLAFKTNLRLAQRGDPAQWQERVFNAYVDWQAPAGVLQARLGRQYVFRGVMNGSVDGLLLRLRPTRRLDLQAVGGVSVPFDRPFAVQPWDDGGVLGGYASYRVARAAQVDLSYVQRSREDALAWRQLGTAVTGAAGALYYQARLDYNLLQQTYQGMRYRLAYQPGRWGFSGEYNSQKPRIYEDSFFNLFRLVGFDQWRGGVTYQLGRYQLGAQYLHTAYRDADAANEIVATLGGGWGTIGVIYQTGFGGDNVGLYGEVDYDVRPDLSLRLHSSYYNYQRRSLSFSEDATAFSGGVHYRPVRTVLLQAELQQAMNSFFDNDLRALLRASYAF